MMHHLMKYKVIAQTKHTIKQQVGRSVVIACVNLSFIKLPRTYTKLVFLNSNHLSTYVRCTYVCTYTNY